MTWPRLSPLLLLPIGAVAWGQTDTDASTAGAYGLAGLGLGVGLKLVGIIGDLVKDKIAQRSGGSPSPTTAASMSVGSLLEDRQAVLDAARLTGEVWKATAQPDGNGQPRLLAHQAEVARQMRDLVAQVEATSAAQAASTASTAALVAVLRELLAMSPAAEAARSRVRGDR